MSLNVRINLGTYDFAHPSEKEVQVYATIPDVVRVGYLLPARFWDELRDAEWIDALNTAHDYYTNNVWVDTGRAEKTKLREWLAVDEHQDALNVAWFEDRARRDPVSRALMADKKRLSARVTELEQQLAAAQAPRIRPAPRPRRFEGVPDAVLESTLRDFVATHLNYDMHKNLEQPEDGAPDRYPELTREFAKRLALTAEYAGFEVEPWDGE